jgi:hypothetical protein
MRVKKHLRSSFPESIVQAGCEILRSFPVNKSEGSIRKFTHEINASCNTQVWCCDSPLCAERLHFIFNVMVEKLYKLRNFY